MERHRFHSICPYFAMFPEDFARQHIAAWTEQDDLVFDPFSGRGTAILESLLWRRNAAGTDTNPVAVCLSGAKADPPSSTFVRRRLSELRRLFERRKWRPVAADDFFTACFAPKTMAQLELLRRHLSWQSSRVDRFIAAIALGCLHGESHRSERYFSNRMPRTISTKPAYSVRWWKEHGYRAPERDIFEIIEREVAYRFESDPAPVRGRVALQDARKAWRCFPSWKGAARLVVTSPPYLDTTNFREDQWLRLWFLGGPGHPPRDGRRDDRHVSATEYWKFLAEAWGGVAPLCGPDTVFAVRIGGKRLNLESAIEGLEKSFAAGLERAMHVSEARQSEIVNSQAQSFRPRDNGARHEFDVVLKIKKRRVTGGQKLASRKLPD